MSCPAILANGPFCPKPVILANINEGLVLHNTDGPKLYFSNTPKKKQKKYSIMHEKNINLNFNKN